MQTITIETAMPASPQKTWEFYTTPEHIMRWNHASPDWTCPSAEHDLRVGGTFAYRMEAKDGSAGFDFTGTFTAVEPGKRLSYTIDDRRQVDVRFEADRIVVTFEAEGTHSIEQQRAGWQAILDNFREYVESAR